MSRHFKYFGRAVRKIRESQGLSQTELAVRLGFNPGSGTQFISNVERGQSGLPTEAAKVMVSVFRLRGMKELLKTAIFADASLEAKSRCDEIFKK